MDEKYLNRGYSEEQLHHIWKAQHERGLTDEDIDYFLSIEDDPMLLPFYATGLKHTKDRTQGVMFAQQHKGVSMEQKKRAMPDASKKRFAKSLGWAIESLAKDAFGYCYSNDAEYVELVSSMKALQKRLLTEVQQNKQKLKEAEQELFKQALNEAVSNKFDELAAQASEESLDELWEQSVRQQEALIAPSTLTPNGDCLGDGSHDGYRFMCPECPYGEDCAPECQ